MDWFPEEEYRLRWDRARGLMAEEGLDALLITSDPNYRYFTGHRPFCPWATLTRANIALIPLSDEPVILAHLFHLEDVKASSPVKDVRPYSDLATPPLDELMDALSSRKLLDKTIGAELGREQRLGVPFSDFIELQRRAHEALFRDGRGLVR
ncbi:MAG: aminopeptidase P family N-terminal domain-containing protein [Nitrospinota bacterium]